MVITMISLGVILLIMGLIYLYKLQVVFKINRFFKSNIFNDAVIISEHRKIGLFLVLLAIISLYAGFSKMQVLDSSRKDVSFERTQNK